MKRFNNVAVLMGGPSAERDVSMRSGKAVAGGLREAGYSVVEVIVDGHDFKLPKDVEAVFIALHGEFGEDGGVQAVLDGMDMPYTGSGSQASKAAFDKVLTKKIFVEKGISSPGYEVLREGMSRTKALPVVVKPSSQGSSIGVHRVELETDWSEAMADALLYDKDVIVEDYIEGRELTVGIVKDMVLPVVEIEAPDGWYDYRAKYVKGTSNYLVPAPLDEDVVKKCQVLAMKTFKGLGCRGIGRVDIRLGSDGGLYVLELNSIPGFTETSLLPKAAAANGIVFSRLCDIIMDTARTGE